MKETPPRIIKQKLFLEDYLNLSRAQLQQESGKTRAALSEISFEFETVLPLEYGGSEANSGQLKKPHT
ncbi:MAG: hypothetical protein K2X27_08285 [Candidatus Obscuribacterales bacterium]|nr:hypothetical protein [Candidatus Obscuribacterales bacterium]